MILPMADPRAAAVRRSIQSGDLDGLRHLLDERPDLTARRSSLLTGRLAP